MVSPTQSPPPVEEDEHLEVDYDDNTSDGDSFGSYSTSLGSSVFEYVYENGRRYHGYRSGKYMLPNDDTEQERLDMVHHAWSLFLQGKLTLVPTDGLERVLDVGTGTGIWPMDLGDAFPHIKEIIGADLSPIQPQWVAPNVKYVVDDMEQVWAYPKNYFDLVHFRGMSGALRDWKGVLKKCFDHIKPGGYIELCDIDISRLYSDDGSYKDDNPLHLYYKHMWGAMQKMGLGTHIDEWSGLVQEAGFTDIQNIKSKFPMGRWPKDKRKKELGMWCLEVAKLGFESYALKVFTDVEGMSQKDAEELIRVSIEAAQDRNLHSYWATVVVTARKPLDAEC